MYSVTSKSHVKNLIMYVIKPDSEYITVSQWLVQLEPELRPRYVGKNGVLLGNLRNGNQHALTRDLNMITSE
jgi:hypothetical protein